MSVILKYYKSVSINILSIYPLVFTILSLVKRINANRLSIYLINTIILSDLDQFNVYLLFYDVLIFYIISLLFLKLNLKVKRKCRYKKTFKNLKSILKNYNNYNIVFNSSRKLGSYIWFYTLIKPIKLDKHYPVIDFFDIDNRIMKNNKNIVFINDMKEDCIRNILPDYYKLKQVTIINNLYIYIYTYEAKLHN